jgi:hypothetical protein
MITADTTLYTADTHCVTADGRIICVDADVVEALVALDAIDAAVGANVVSATVVEPADALDQLDGAVVAGVVSIPGGGYYRPLRPRAIEAIGYGILPQLEGEAHGEVGSASVATLSISGVACPLAIWPCDISRCRRIW